jgi:hypothetical protein
VQPIEITREAIGDHVKAIALEVGRDKSLIYKWLAEADSDPYSRMVALLEAAYRLNPEGAELFYLDFRARFYALKEGELIKGASWDETLSDALQIFAEAVRTRNGNPMFQMKIARVIRTLEWLLRQQAADRIE